MGDDVLIIAIDGPSGVGKTTVARRLAARLSLPMLDTGAMYRAVALKVLNLGVDPGDQAGVLNAAAEADITVALIEGATVVQLDGEPVGERIRTQEVSETTSQISTYPEIRQRMVELQREAAQRAGAVVEGRDIGTVVFPTTPHKFFLTARPEVRADRRYQELVATEPATTFDEVMQDLERRDARDAGREESPLTYDDSYTVVDSSHRPPDAIVEEMVAAVRATH